MKIETDRLIIVPLNENQLKDYISDDNVFEYKFKLNIGSRKINEEVKKVVKNEVLPKFTSKSDNFLFFTFWTVINKKENIIVADICFKGKPNKEGEIEIGYGTYSKYKNKGYMTETVSGIIDWARQQKNIKSIVAETNINNFASIRILKKNGFSVKGKVNNEITWNLKTQI